MVRQAKVIVRAKIEDGVRLAVVIDRGPRLSRGHQFGFVQLDRPGAHAHPLGKARGSFERVAAFAAEEIAETELCRIDLIVHRGKPGFETTASVPVNSRVGPAWKETVREKGIWFNETVWSLVISLKSSRPVFTNGEVLYRG